MISKSDFLKKIFVKKTKDYTYATIFILVFSFFIISVIKPSLSTIFTLSRKLADLKKIDTQYETQVMQIVNLQSTLELIREDLYLLDQSVSTSPKVNKVINDVKLAAEESNLKIDKMNVSDVNLKENLNKVKMHSFIVHIEASGSFQNILEFVKETFDQRRLKWIQQIVISKKDKIASDSSQLKFSFDMEAYYL